MIRLVLKILGVLLLVAYLSVAGVLYGLGREPARYRDVKIIVTDSNEIQFLRASDIKRQMQALKINPKGKTFDEIDTHMLRKRIEENKLVRHAYCYHTPDSLLRIDIVQRRPIMRVKSDRQIEVQKDMMRSDFYIDDEGETMPFEFGASAPQPLPLVTGSVTRKIAQRDLLRLARFLQGNRFWRELITQFNVLPNGDIEFATRVNKATVLLGPIDESFELRMEHLKTFYDEVLPRKGWNAYTRINAKFEKQIIGEK